MIKMNSATTLELVTFKAKPGTPDDAMRQAAHAVTPRLEIYPGFKARSLAKADDETWIDAVYWTNRASAEHAAQSIMQDAVAQAFFALIDPTTMVFKHASITTPKSEAAGAGA
jgi:hypothetical protein